MFPCQLITEIHIIQQKMNNLQNKKIKKKESRSAGNQDPDHTQLFYKNSKEHHKGCNLRHEWYTANGTSSLQYL